MRTTDKHLERLFKAAAGSQEAGSTVPYSLQARILAQWRSPRNADEAVPLLSLFRAGLLCSCLLLLLTAAVSVHRLNQASHDFLATSNAMIKLVSFP
jgi:hypothetical protein